MGNAHKTAGRYDEAATAYAEVLDLAQGIGLALLALGETAAITGDPPARTGCCGRRSRFRAASPTRPASAPG